MIHWRFHDLYAEDMPKKVNLPQRSLQILLSNALAIFFNAACSFVSEFNAELKAHIPRMKITHSVSDPVPPPLRRSRLLACFRLICLRIQYQQARRHSKRHLISCNPTALQSNLTLCQGIDLFVANPSSFIYLISNSRKFDLCPSPVNFFSCSGVKRNGN